MVQSARVHSYFFLVVFLLLFSSNNLLVSNERVMAVAQAGRNIRGRKHLRDAEYINI